MTCSKNNTLWLCCVAVVILIAGCRHNKPSVSEADVAHTQEQLVEVNKIMVRKDRQRIQGYVDRHEMNMKETETGLWYEIIDSGTGVKAESGKMVTLGYNITLIDGTPCYNSDTDGTKTFLIGRGGVESGLEEGVLKLNEGGKAKFIMPPHLAYGLPGDGNKIPPRAIIVYNVEILSID